MLLLRHALLSAAPAQTFGIITLMFDNTVVSACLTYFVQWLVTKYRDSAGKVPTASCVHRGVCVCVSGEGLTTVSLPACPVPFRYTPTTAQRCKKDGGGLEVYGLKALFP